MDAVERGTPTENIKLIDCFPTQKRTEQPTQPKDVIEMSMREQNSRQVLKARARLQYLTLRTLTAIDQETIFIVFNDLC